MHLDCHLLPSDPEEALMARILMNLQNLLEQETEVLMRVKIPVVSFKGKYDLLRRRYLIRSEEWTIMDEIRRLRNAHVHTRTTKKRSKYTYRREPLMTRNALRILLVDAERVLRNLRAQSGAGCRWSTVPPGYASEMGWPQADVALLDRERAIVRSNNALNRTAATGASSSSQAGTRRGRLALRR
jgi:hypothetical protein